jgi:hypothetical protein
MTYDLSDRLARRGKQLTIFDICAAQRELDPKVLANMAFGPRPAPEPANTSAANDNRNHRLERILARLCSEAGKADGGMMASDWPEVPYV